MEFLRIMAMAKGLIFLGAPGSGKGTQAVGLAETLAIPHISTGDMLRQAIADGTELGNQAKGYMDRGELVPDQLILGLIEERLGYSDTKNGWILDGFPRNVNQAIFLDELLVNIGHRTHWVINLKVPDEVIVERLLARGRADDNEATIRHRLLVYTEQTTPLIAYFQEQGKLYSLDGDQAVEVISATLQKLVKP
ncbi:Adenylate kinase [Synechocystis sp. PCC 6714]|nr:Adenylate kinase [Synechocystis sp. PCC 6714]